MTGALGALLRPEPTQPEVPEPAGSTERARGRAEPRRGELLRGAKRLVDRRQHHVLEHVDVLGVYRVGVDRHLAQLEVARHLDGDHPAAGARLHDLVLELLLRLRHLLLHLLGLTHELVEVGLLGHLGHSSPGGVSSSKISRAPNSPLRRSSSSSSLSSGPEEAGSSSPSRATGRPSPSRAPTIAFWPRTASTTDGHSPRSASASRAGPAPGGAGSA